MAVNTLERSKRRTGVFKTIYSIFHAIGLQRYFVFLYISIPECSKRRYVLAVVLVDLVLETLQFYQRDEWGVDVVDSVTDEIVL